MDGKEKNRKFRQPVILAVLIVSGVLTVSGCANHIPLEKTVPEPILYQANDLQPDESAAASGSLWHDSGPLSNLFASRKAARVGDILTVSIVESATAMNKADTKTERTSDMTAGVDKFFNWENKLNTTGFNPFAAITAALTSGFDGKATTKRSGSLAATISVRVTRVLPNGNLVIAGSRDVTVNNERQYITLSGIIRPDDISSNNVIQSIYISDARIAYSGVGVLNDRQRPGWLTRVFDVIWPF